MITQEDYEYLSSLPHLGERVGLLDLTKKWYTSDEATIQVARILDLQGVFQSPNNAIDYFETPHKYEWKIQMLIDEFEEAKNDR